MLGFDSGIPHNGEGMDLEASRTTRRVAVMGSARPAHRRAAGRSAKGQHFETFDDDDAGTTPRNNSSQLQRTIPPESSDTGRTRAVLGLTRRAFAEHTFQNHFRAEPGRRMLIIDRGAPSLPVPLGKSAAYGSHTRAVAKGELATAALMMPLLVSDLPERRLQAKQNRFRRLLDPMIPKRAFATG